MIREPFYYLKNNMNKKRITITLRQAEMEALQEISDRTGIRSATTIISKLILDKKDEFFSEK